MGSPATIGVLTLELRIEHAHSLKDKRQVVKGLKDRLRRKFNVSVSEIDDQELHRGGVSYTIDTLRDYAKHFPGAQMFYLVGGDHVEKLPAWREAEELARLAEFIVVPRPGETETPIPQPFRGRTLKGFPFGVSSSQIRARVQSGQPIDHLVPAAVAEAIRGSGLYT